MSKLAKLDWLKFFALLLPELRALARKLYERHGGDLKEAIVELKHIGDHGKQLVLFEQELQRRMAELKARSAARDAERAAATAFAKRDEGGE